MAPCIIFIDEIDAVGSTRKQWEGHTKKTLHQLLVEMDGFDQNEGIILMAATNLPDILDPALTRPGRFDRHIVVPNPDVRGRQEILELYLQDKPLADNVDVKAIARGTPGFNGAGIWKLKQFIDDCKSNSSILSDPSLPFFQDYLERYLDHNQFTGRIPDAFYKHTFLKEMYIEGNAFRPGVNPIGVHNVLEVSDIEFLF
ncbi:unnamed protein product [Camellia sinensis]